jgi:predicted DNA-binding transcriptional regulator AlpA
MSIPELASRLGIKMTWLYEQSRMDMLPGKVRVGSQVFVDTKRFDEAKVPATERAAPGAEFE